jgi:hypothetical protein
MTFTDVYASLLLPYIKNYEAAKNQKGRKEVLANAVDAVQKSRNLLEDTGDSLPNDLRTVCLLSLKFIYSLSVFID